jgi:hypothetical protein
MARPALAATAHEAPADVGDDVGGDVGGDVGDDVGERVVGVAAAMTGPATGDAYLDKVHVMQKESQLFNAQLLQLQEEVQAENRRFTTLSNVCRARHDAANACVKNIH